MQDYQPHPSRVTDGFIGPMCVRIIIKGPENDSPRFSRAVKGRDVTLGGA